MGPVISNSSGYVTDKETLLCNFSGIVLNNFCRILTMRAG